MSARVTPKVLSRLTTVFHPNEDRIRISGQVNDGTVQVIWLTQRLANRLVPVLTQWLEQRDEGTPRADLLQGVKQQNAQVQQARADSGPAVPAEAAECEWLAVSLDVQKREEALRVVFKDCASKPSSTAALELAPMLLRQWLNVLLQVYTQAEWPLDSWPAWMLEQVKPAAKPEPRALH